jgi:superfamily II DNA or RNA helicase
MNVKIDAWAWLPRESLTHIQQAAIKAALTIYPKKVGDFPGDAPTPLKLFKETDTHLAVPRAYYTKYRKPEHQIEEATTLGRHDLWSGPFDFEGTLRSEQQRALREVSTLFRNGEYGGIVRAVTGWGKTVWSCALMAEMKVPTLVIVHKEFLLNQWKERIEQFLPNVKVGIVQQDRCEYKDAGVMIGMIHSLVGSRDYGKDFWEWPGLIITDETHRVGAETWSAVPTKFKAKWRLGVSATPRRKDGAEDVFFHHIGPVIVTSSEQRMTPKIRRVWTEWKMVQTDTLNPNLVSKSVLLKFLVTNKARNTLIVNQLIQAVEAGRRPMVLSERLQHLDALEAQFKRDWTAKHKDKPVTTGFYVGGMKEDELDESAKATIVFATRQFAEEGLDIPVLDTLFLTIPMSDVEQAVGRILRPCEGKKEPVVVDFRDDKVGYCLKAGGYRDRFYQQKGWSTPTTAPATSG